MNSKKNASTREQRIEALVERAQSIKERVQRLGIKRATYQIQGRSHILVRRKPDETGDDTHIIHLTPRR